MENGQSIWDFMNHGDGAMWVVLAFSILALGVAIERAVAQWSFIDRARQLSEQVTRCLARGAIAEARSACERSPSPMADIYLVGYERLGRVAPEHVVTAVHRERQRVNQDLKTRMWVLGTVGATAPFVGLFGTVVGIMSAMNGFKGDMTFEKVAGPISSALIVTAAGIFVAVGAVILFNFFSQRAARIATEMRLLTDEYLELLLETPKDERATPLRKGEADGNREAA